MIDNQFRAMTPSALHPVPASEQARQHPASEFPIPQMSQHPKDDEAELTEIFSALWRGKLTILFCAFLAAVAGAYYALELAAPRFSSTVQLVLQAQNQNIVDLDSVISGVSTEDAAINTELEVVKSRGLIEKLIDNLGLVEDPEFNKTLREPSILSVDGLLGLAARILPISAPTQTLSENEIKAKVIDAVRNVISVESRRKTYLINISFKSEDKAKSEELANALAALYLENQIEIKFSATKFAVTWLSDQVATLEADLRQREDAIEDLRSESDLVSFEALEALNIRSKDIRERLTNATGEAEVAIARVARLQAASDLGDIDLALADITSTELSALGARAKAGDQSARDAFFSRLSQVLRTEQGNSERAAARQQALEVAYDQILEQIGEQNEDLQEINKLVPEADATRILYETFLARLKETSVQVGLQQADSRILSRATPGRLVEPRTGLLIASALILGGIIGVALVLIRQFQNSGFRTDEELAMATGHPVLALIPLMPLRRRQGLVEYLSTKPTSAAAEAFRNLRTSVLMSRLQDPPKIIMSTSSVPGEGKTTQAISLAHNFAGLGKRVLLVEGDIRRRTINEYFKSALQRNLVKVISGELSLQEGVYHDEQLNIDLMLSEKSSMNAADLLSSTGFEAFLRTARDSYDIVIIDTPPVLVVPDARIIAPHMDAIIYSVAWDRTARTEVVSGLKQFASVNVQVTGLVLGKIDNKRMRAYGYGDRYGAYSNYGGGYYDI